IEKEYTELVIKKEEHVRHNETRKIQARLEMIRGVISIERVRKVINLTAKKKEAINIIQDLVNLAQSRFIEHIWKFRCELMAEWKVKEGIAKDNKQKPQTAKEILDPKSPKKQK
ncbi:13921_t:CDS:2, partial [Gigaspora margarita]